MSDNSISRTSIVFNEHPHVFAGQNHAHAFDVILKAPFSFQKYLKGLSVKIFDTGLSEVVPFINYQCTLVKEPVSWINSFEKLIKCNSEKFNTPALLHRHFKWVSELAVKRSEINTASLGDYRQKLIKRHVIALSDKYEYSFILVKEQLKNIVLLEDKIAFLQEQIFNYRQDSIIYTSKQDKSFEELCQLEIDKLENREELRLKAIQKAARENSNDYDIGTMQLFMNLNIFVDFFFQCMHEIKIDNHPALEATNSQVAEWIHRHFIDRNGKPVSIKAIQTILEVKRPEKRPKEGKRFKFI